MRMKIDAPQVQEPEACCKKLAFGEVAALQVVLNSAGQHRSGSGSGIQLFAVSLLKKSAQLLAPNN
jgi:hypothetical protein